ncbi:MAG: hypothetical protein HY515_00120, partial [Candidatus Aenigmarchaeota archaeon]|nr:hypothetical protein [Candidatus Aenigmarchaeota archaeon]
RAEVRLIKDSSEADINQSAPTVLAQGDSRSDARAEVRQQRFYDGAQKVKLPYGGIKFALGQADIEKIYALAAISRRLNHHEIKGYIYLDPRRNDQPVVDFARMQHILTVRPDKLRSSEGHLADFDQIAETVKNLLYRGETAELAQWVDQLPEPFDPSLIDGIAISSEATVREGDKIRASIYETSGFRKRVGEAAERFYGNPYFRRHMINIHVHPSFQKPIQDQIQLQKHRFEEALQSLQSDPIYLRSVEAKETRGGEEMISRVLKLLKEKFAPGQDISSLNGQLTVLEAVSKLKKDSASSAFVSKVIRAFYLWYKIGYLQGLLNFPLDFPSIGDITRGLEEDFPAVIIIDQANPDNEYTVRIYPYQLTDGLIFKSQEWSKRERKLDVSHHELYSEPYNREPIKDSIYLDRIKTLRDGMALNHEIRETMLRFRGNVQRISLRKSQAGVNVNAVSGSLSGWGFMMGQALADFVRRQSHRPALYAVELLIEFAPTPGLKKIFLRRLIQDLGAYEDYISEDSLEFHQRITRLLVNNGYLAFETLLREFVRSRDRRKISRSQLLRYLFHFVDPQPVSGVKINDKTMMQLVRIYQGQKLDDHAKEFMPKLFASFVASVSKKTQSRVVAALDRVAMDQRGQLHVRRSAVAALGEIGHLAITVARDLETLEQHPPNQYFGSVVHNALANIRQTVPGTQGADNIRRAEVRLIKDSSEADINQSAPTVLAQGDSRSDARAEVPSAFPPTTARDVNPADSRSELRSATQITVPFGSHVRIGGAYIISFRRFDSTHGEIEVVQLPGPPLKEGQPKQQTDKQQIDVVLKVENDKWVDIADGNHAVRVKISQIGGTILLPRYLPAFEVQKDLPVTSARPEAQVSHTESPVDWKRKRDDFLKRLGIDPAHFAKPHIPVPKVPNLRVRLKAEDLSSIEVFLFDDAESEQNDKPRLDVRFSLVNPGRGITLYLKQGVKIPEGHILRSQIGVIRALVEQVAKELEVPFIDRTPRSEIRLAFPISVYPHATDLKSDVRAEVRLIKDS